LREDHWAKFSQKWLDASTLTLSGSTPVIKENTNEKPTKH
jgi:hypothetical protein